VDNQDVLELIEKVPSPMPTEMCNERLLPLLSFSMRLRPCINALCD